MNPIYTTGAPDIGDASSAVSNALRALAGWAGFNSFEQVMREFDRTKVYLAGGVLRDSFRSGFRVPKDFDFFLGHDDVDAFVKRLAEMGRIEIGPFGSPRWFPAGHDEIYADVILIEHFYNGLWRCRDIIDVLNQFDFTANAIALDLRERALFDPQNGIRDAKAGTMRAVRFDYPDEPLPSDARLSRLGILWTRLMHYAKALDLEIEPVTAKWLHDNSRFGQQEEAFAETFFEPKAAMMDWKRNSANG